MAGFSRTRPLLTSRTRVLQVLQRADVREDIADAAFAKQINWERHGRAEPRDADNDAARTDRIDGLHQARDTRETLFGLPPAHSKTMSAPLPPVDP